MTRTTEILTTFENALEIHKEKRDTLTFCIPIDDVKIIANALRLAQTPSNEACNCEKNNDALAVTADGMASPDYKERFKAEYHQTKIRYERLKAFNTRIEAAFATNYRKNGVEMPAFDCPQDMLREQQKKMGEYLHILEVRAVIEGVDLTSI